VIRHLVNDDTPVNHEENSQWRGALNSGPSGLEREGEKGNVDDGRFP
jgi:hypothetical protein